MTAPPAPVNHAHWLSGGLCSRHTTGPVAFGARCSGSQSLTLPARLCHIVCIYLFVYICLYIFVRFFLRPRPLFCLFIRQIPEQLGLHIACMAGTSLF